MRSVVLDNAWLIVESQYKTTFGKTASVAEMVTSDWVQFPLCYHFFEVKQSNFIDEKNQVCIILWVILSSVPIVIKPVLGKYTGLGQSITYFT